MSEADLIRASLLAISETRFADSPLMSSPGKLDDGVFPRDAS